MFEPRPKKQKRYKWIYLGPEMHHPPDLNLASSYIPACLCVVKCALAFTLFILAPVRGWIGLCCLASVDRLLWNNSQTMLLDVNSVVVSLIGSLMVMHTRAEGVRGLAHLVVIVVWMLFSVPQITGITRLPRAYEVILAGACVSMLSCMHQLQERTEILALRVFVFVVFNTTLPYIDILMQKHLEADVTYVNICRTLLILLGEPEVAGFWVVVYLLCLGYQLRAVSSCQPPSLSLGGCHTHNNSKRVHDYQHDVRPMMVSSSFCAPADESDHSSVTIPSTASASRFVGDSDLPPDDPFFQLQLREALASRRGFVGEGPV
jgi:hypothetical protein